MNEGDEFNSILTYFEENYVSSSMRGHKKPAKFQIELWNIVERTANSLPRTNNHIEGFNNRLQAAFSCSYPNVWTLLSVLKKEHKLSLFKRNKIMAG